MAKEFRFSLKINREKYLQYYEGKATVVQTYTENGLLIQFPASALKSWVTHLGIQGYFVIKFDVSFHCNCTNEEYINRKGAY